MSELLKQIEAANAKNRRNVHLAMAEFAHKLTQEANGIPMKREPNAWCEYNYADGRVKFIPVRI